MRPCTGAPRWITERYSGEVGGGRRSVSALADVWGEVTVSETQGYAAAVSATIPYGQWSGWIVNLLVAQWVIHRWGSHPESAPA